MIKFYTYNLLEVISNDKYWKFLGGSPSRLFERDPPSTLAVQDRMFDEIQLEKQNLEIDVIYWHRQNWTNTTKKYHFITIV